MGSTWSGKKAQDNNKKRRTHGLAAFPLSPENTTAEHQVIVDSGNGVHGRRFPSCLMLGEDPEELTR